VVELGFLPSRRVVAVGTRHAEATLMHRWIGMTGHAGLRRFFIGVVDVALCAGDHLMSASQFERGHGVIKVGEAGQFPQRAVVFAVTFPAVLYIRQFTMQRLPFSDLAADVRVAVLAARSHRLAAPRRSMTRGTVLREFRVRVDAMQCNSGPAL